MEKYLVHYFDSEVGNRKYVIWTITAAILIKAATLLIQGHTTFLFFFKKLMQGIRPLD